MSRYAPQSEGIRLRRLGTFLIDVAPLWFVVALLPESVPPGRLGVVPLFIAYRAIFVLADRPTIGKGLLDLAVETQAGDRPSHARLLARDLPYATAYVAIWILSMVIDRDPQASVTREAIPAVMMLGLINFAFWDLVVGLIVGSRSLHDFWAGTRVVGSPAAWEVESRQPTSP